MSARSLVATSAHGIGNWLLPQRRSLRCYAVIEFPDLMKRCSRTGYRACDEGESVAGTVVGECCGEAKLLEDRDGLDRSLAEG